MNCGYLGKGVVVVITMGIIYVASLFVQLRVLRQTVKSQLPIEVFYTHNPSSRKYMKNQAAIDNNVADAPTSILAHLRREFPDVSFINVYEELDVPAGLALRPINVPDHAGQA